MAQFAEKGPEDDFEIEYEVIQEAGNSEFVPSTIGSAQLPTSARELGFANGDLNKDYGSTSPEQRGKNPRDRPQTRNAQNGSQERIKINGNNISPQATILNQQYRKSRKNLPDLDMP